MNRFTFQIYLKLLHIYCGEWNRTHTWRYEGTEESVEISYVIDVGGLRWAIKDGENNKIQLKCLRDWLDIREREANDGFLT